MRPELTAIPVSSDTTLLVTDCIVCACSGGQPLKYSSRTSRPFRATSTLATRP